MSFKSIVNGQLTDHKSSPCHYVIGELKKKNKKKRSKNNNSPHFNWET